MSIDELTFFSTSCWAMQSPVANRACSRRHGGREKGPSGKDRQRARERRLTYGSREGVAEQRLASEEALVGSKEGGHD